MWVIAEYEATTLFTLKPATATASGGKTLLVPTPYAIKMALLDVACRLEGQNIAEVIWDDWLRGMTVALLPAQAVVVNNTFTKVLRPRRNPAEPGSQHAGFFQKTIAYREYAYLAGPFALALWVQTDTQAGTLARWLVNVNYLGKRGSFIQITQPPTAVNDLPGNFIVIDGQIAGFALDSVLTQLDDTGDGLTFSRASIYTSERITLGKERILRHVAMPYQLIASSRSYSHYQRSES